MRNVDREVLIEAIEEAQFKDLFPTSSAEILSAIGEANNALSKLLEEQLGKLTLQVEDLAERNAALEALAFGTVIMKLVRSVMFFMRLLPQARIIMLLIGLFMVAEKVMASQELPGKQELLGVVSELGLSDAFEEFKSAAAEVLKPFLDELNELKKLGDEVFDDVQFNIQNMESQFTKLVTYLDAARNNPPSYLNVENVAEHVARSIQPIRINTSEMGNLISNFDTFVFRGKLDSVTGGLTNFLHQQEE